MSYRTPLARVRGLGSAKEGTGLFWVHRLTAVSNLILVSFIVCVLARLAGADYGTVKATLGRPLVAVPLLLLIVSGTVHMRIGMQSIIEDYVHSHGQRIVAMALNSFFAFIIAVSCAFAVLKLSFGA
jgi:succinate dehydrogenase / fumarate reductase, membrane anchor subunit